MFLVHPTRLSKIFADSRTHPYGNARHRQASKLARLHSRKKRAGQSQKLELLEKNLPGRPYSAPAVARAEFCYHSLNEDLKDLYHITASAGKPAVSVRPSKSATSSEYQNHYWHASPLCKFFSYESPKSFLEVSISWKVKVL